MAQQHSHAKSSMMICAACHHNGSDIRLRACGCTLHARCVPLSLVLEPRKSETYSSLPVPVMGPTSRCPACQANVTGIEMMPLDFSDLEKAIEIQRTSLQSKGSASSAGSMPGQAPSPRLPSSSSLSSSTSTSYRTGQKHPRDEAANGSSYAESLYLIMSNSCSSLSSSSASGLSAMDLQRTGRWTEDEIRFVDFLVKAFDHGGLPLPHGIKLNEFLGEILLCKSSRLTKKMKNAKLSTRSFELGLDKVDILKNCKELSNLQEKFLASISSKTMQLQLRFNLTKQWRTHFSNMCVQVGYTLLDGNAWISSLEEIERRASQAEEDIRRTRRRRMGLALRTDTGASTSRGVFIDGVKADAASDIFSSNGGFRDGTNMHMSKRVQVHTTAGPDTLAQRPLLVTSAPAGAASANVPLQTNHFIHESDLNMSLNLETSTRKVSASGPSSNHSSEKDFFNSMMDSMADDSMMQDGCDRLQNDEGARRGRPRTFSEDFNAVLSDLMDSTDPPSDNLPPFEPEADGGAQIVSNHPAKQNRGPFLDTVVSYITSKNLPFQHVDIFVPSFIPVPPSSDDDPSAPAKQELRLFQAGFVTRPDVDPLGALQWNEFGVYSEKFSFQSGHGLVGRVYASGAPSWEKCVHDMDPQYFERAGGAKVYGVKTAVGIPLSTPMVGRICIVLYSSAELDADNAMMEMISEELTAYSPEPKWRLVIETNDEQSPSDADSNADAEAKADSSSGGTTHPPTPQKQTMAAETVATSNQRNSFTAPNDPFSAGQQQLVNPPPQQNMFKQASARVNSAQNPRVVQDSRTNKRSVAVADAIDNEEEQCLVSLLGDCMPSSALPLSAGDDASAGSSGAETVSTSLLPHFIQIRLLLLRPPSRRSTSETDALNILKKSYRSYSKNNRRSGPELANLLVRDWVCLKSAFEAGDSAANTGVDVHQSQANSSISSLPPSSSLAMPLSMSMPPSTQPKVSPVRSVSSSTNTPTALKDVYKSHVMGATLAPAHTMNRTPPVFPTLSNMMKSDMQLQQPSDAGMSSLCFLPPVQHAASSDSLGSNHSQHQIHHQTSQQHQQMSSASPMPLMPSPLSSAGVTPEGPSPLLSKRTRSNGSGRRPSTVASMGPTKPLPAQPQMGHSNMILRG